ncbi:cystathionine gamma-synthase [Candidatus Roizmanbacteria bacterium RIFCSPHIGHO2_02_FULL_37_13b]|uniref:Cystathionine gamma-synthase n=1 Tax=Candidatus Roizmanbacteria bacterium RIFCSPLOWO2_02_FULL_36_11 TaxID=1802071 RepID=A0A1F7JII3_9BACT|nr:MAG: cystathionine gamma-synthase [Candidatus Roizmanbacteria bacterium RIFCSPHIGHO2_02_FULL_37_13b]OGK55418.1 MAG: cystathionine gamma-synthase [Candidatus Roizmanbacteria bacterium RIFCSPLOWO2_02_FULL_36_11]
MKISTKSIHIGGEPNFKNSGDVVVPIHLSSTFARERVNQPTAGYEYSRTGNPTRKALERNLAALENGRYAFAYSSGLAAETNALFLLKQGDHIVVIDDVYGGTRRLFTQVFSKFGLNFSFIDFSGDKINILNETINKKTKMIWLESPTNPLLKVLDIEKIAQIGRKCRLITVVDNTFATPIYQRPLELGADIVLHSTTKYLNGHSDSVGGAIVVKDKKLASKLLYLQNAIGAVLSPFDSYLLLRGLKTLTIRMQKHSDNAHKVVKFLQSNTHIKKINYPGFSGMVSFELDLNLRQSIRFLESLKLIHIAESLGAVESLVEHPATMTHASIPYGERIKIGLHDGLIRLSVGLEDVNDLIQDLRQALQQCVS